MNVVAYLRGSTEEQINTIAAQRDRLKHYAKAYDLNLVETIADSESGKNLDRPGIQRALAMLRTGEAEGLLIAKLDRLTRDQGDWAKLLKEFFGVMAPKNWTT